MIVEHRTYRLHPAKVGQYLRIYEEEVLAIQRPILGDMIGYFSTDVGPLNQIVHLWGFDSHDDRQKRRAILMADDAWLAASARLHPLIISMRSKILLPAAFSPIGGIDRS